MISNSNNSILVTERLQDSSEFRCTVSNGAGYSRSRATVTVLSKEQITIQIIRLDHTLYIAN